MSGKRQSWDSHLYGSLTNSLPGSRAVSAAHDARACDAFLNADAVWCSLFSPRNPLVVSETLGPLFRSPDTCFIAVNRLCSPSLHNENASGSPAIVYQPTSISFFPFFFFFFKARAKFLCGLGKSPEWGNNIDVYVHTQRFVWIVFWVKMFPSRNTRSVKKWQQTISPSSCCRVYP